MNNPLKIYSGSDVLLYTTPINNGCRRKVQLMSEDSITVKFSDKTKMRFPVGTRIGDFYITKEQQEKYNATTGGYDYELKFDAYYWLWANKLLFYAMPGVTNAPRETSFKLTATIDVHASVILRCLNALGFTYDGSPFRVDTDADFSTEVKYINYANMSVLGGIQAIAEAYECEWWVVGNAIHFGKCNAIGEYDFTVGSNVASITSDSKETAPNRLIIFGSDRNLPVNYRTEESSDTVDAIVTKRLMLPEGTPYLQTSPDIPEDEIVEKEIVLDSIYPRTALTISDVVTYEAEAKDGKKQTFYRIKYGNTFPFLKEYILPNEELHIVFESGDLNGMDFAVKFNPLGVGEKKDDGSINPDAQMFEVVVNEDYGRALPDATLHPIAGNLFSLYGWDSTKMEALGLIADAEQELLAEGNKLVVEYQKDIHTYTCPMMWDWCKDQIDDQQKSMPALGSSVNLHFTAGDDGRKSRIIGYEHDLDIEYSNVTYICGEKVSVSRIKTLESKVEGLAKDGSKARIQNSLDFLSKRYSDRTPYRLASDLGFEVGKYLAGVSGGMFGIDKTDGQSFADVFNLWVRGKAYFETLTTIEAETLAGKQYITPGGAIKCTAVGENGLVEVVKERPSVDEDCNPILDENGQPVMEEYTEMVDNGIPEDVYRCYFLSEQDGEKTETKMIAGDQAISEMFNARTGTANKVSNHRYWRKVEAVSNDAYTDDAGNHYGYIDLSKTDCKADSDAPKAGDVIAQLGNKTVAIRQAAMIFSTVDADAPSIKLLTGIGTGETMPMQYTLDGKNIISQGYDHEKGHAYFNCYGDTYIGAPDGSTYVKYDQDAKRLDVNACLNVGSTLGNETFEEWLLKHGYITDAKFDEFVTQYTDTINEIKAQNDRKAETWYQATDPSTVARPNGWLGEQESEHKGDLWYCTDDIADSQCKKDTTWFWNGTEWSQQNVPQSVFDTIDGKADIFVSIPTDGYKEKDLWFLEAEYTLSGVKYPQGTLVVAIRDMEVAWSADDWTKKDRYTDDTKANEALNQILDYEYLKNAFFEDTLIDKGLILSTLISLGYTDTAGIRHTMAGMNGSWVDSLGGRTIGSWWGGPMVDLFDVNGSKKNLPAGDHATSLVRMDGTGYFVDGLFRINKTGLEIGDTVNGYGISMGMDGRLALGNGIEINIGGEAKGLGESIASVTNLANTLGNLFTPFNGNTEETWKRIIEGKATYDNVRINAGAWTESFLSARGQNGNGTSGGGAVYLHELMDTVITNPQTNQVLTYNGQKWVNQTISIPSLSGYATESWVEGKGYITSAALNGYATQQWVNAKGYITSSDLTPYLTADDAASTYVAKESGKGLSSNDFTTALLNKLNGIEAGANKYVLPTASATVSGGVKVGARLSIDANGVLSATYIYTLPTASASVKGGVKVGGGLAIANEVLSVNLSASHIPALPISKITGLQTALDSKLNKSLFDELFEKVNIGSPSSPVYAIKAKFGLYTEQFLSARGINPGGSGSGGVFYLHELLDTAISNPASGQALVYNGTKWINQAIQTGLDEAALASYLTTNNYAKKSDIPSLAGYATETWVTDKGYITSAALNGYATQSWVQQQGYLTAHQTIRTLTIQKNGTAVGTFNPTGSANATLNISDVASASTLSSHTGNTTVHITAAERTKWNKVVTDFAAITGSDSDTVINKWEEVVAFLDTYTEADTLAGLLSNKADKTTSINAGTGLTGGGTLAASRTLSLAASGVTAGTYTKVTVDTYGRVTAGATLAVADIPSLPWSKITSGKPTTLSGYGITDAYTKTEADGRYVNLTGAQTISGAKTFSSPIKSTFVSSTWLNGTKNAALTLNHSGYSAVWCAPVKDGRVGLSTYPAADNNVYLGYVPDGQTSNGLLKKLVWTADTGNLLVDSLNTASIVIGGCTITWDSQNGMLKFNKGIYSEGSVSALGANPNSGGGGGGLIQTVYAYKYLGGDSFSNNTTTDTFNAYTINRIYTDLSSRIYSLEGGSALSVVTSGSGNAITAISKSGTTITATKGATFLTAHQSLANYYTKGEADGRYLRHTALNGGLIPASATTWGNSTGTQVAEWTDSAGSCAFKFKKDNPSSGKMSMLIDGTVYINEGLDAVASQSWANGRYPLKDGTGASGNWNINIKGNAANAATVGGYPASKFMVNFGSSEIDLNTATTSGVYRLSNTNANLPSGCQYGQMLVLHGGQDTIGQLAMSYSDSGRIAVRSGSPSQVGGSGSWGSWRTLAFTTDTVANANSLGGVAASQYARIAQPNNFVHAGNEITMIPAGYTSDTLWFNYRSGSDGNTCSLTKYYMGNGTKGGVASVVAASFIRNGGTSSQFLKADGSVDSNSYLTTGTASSTYVKKSGDTMTGTLRVMEISLSSSNEINSATNGNLYIAYSNTASLNLCHNNAPLTYGSASNTIWHAGNDGSGSGLDADLLDGVHASGLFTGFSLSNSQLTATIGGVSKTVETVLSKRNGGYNSMNAVAALGNCMGMTDLSGTSTLVNPNAQTSWHHFINLSYNYESTNMWQTQFAIKAGTTQVWVRSRSGGTISDTVAWAAPWVQLARTTDNVASATKLQTARTINGTSFNGTANITTASWGTARNIYIADATAAHTGAAVSVNGGGNATLKLPATITAALVGNASTATTLQTTRTLWGQNFNGDGNVSGNISGCPRIYNAASSNMYLGNSDNSGWVLTQDICSHSAAGDTYWSLRTNGTLHCKTALVGTSTSSYALNCASFICDSWVRSKGATGWYNETYGGGWHMTDSTWVRVYGNKYVYGGSGVIRTDGAFQIGDAGSAFHAQSNGTVTASGLITGSSGHFGAVYLHNSDEINRFGGALYLQHRGGGLSGYGSTGNIYMCANGGNVGVGTAAPAQKLHVNGSLQVDANSFLNGNVYQKYFNYYQRDTVGVYMGVDNDDNFVCHFHENKSWVKAGFKLFYADQKIQFWGPVYSVVGVYSDGYVSARGQNTSDARLKTDIRDFRATDIIRSLRPKSFRWNAEARQRFKVLDTDDVQYGLIAQETDVTNPWLVDRNMFGDGYMGIRYEKLIPVLLKGEIEIVRLTESLDARVKRLEKENEELKLKIESLTN